MFEFIAKLKRNFNKNENSRIIINNIFGSFVIKGGALIVSLLTLPAYIRYFDNQSVIGVWFTVLSVLSWVLTFDLGIGNGLRNQLVPLLVNKDQLRMKKYISSAYIIIGIVVVVISLLSLIAIQFIDWNIFFNIPSELVPIKSLRITISIIFIGIMLQFFLKLITSILHALQKSALNNLLGLLSSIFILCFVSIAKPDEILSSLVLLAIVYVFAINIPLLLATIVVFSKSLKECRPEVRSFSIEYAKEVIKLGGLFFWVQIMYMVIVTTNEFIITWLVGPDQIVEYLIYNKLFSLVGTLFILALTPIWSAVSKAIAEKNFLWIKNLYKKLILMTVLAIIFQFSLIPFLQYIINIWLGDDAIQVNILYSVIFSVYGSIFIWSGVLSSVANGFGHLKTQSIFFTIGVVLKFPSAWFFIEVFDSWIGAVLANIVALSMYCIVQPIWINKVINKREVGDERYV